MFEAHGIEWRFDFCAINLRCHDTKGYLYPKHMLEKKLPTMKRILSHFFEMKG
jgi:hypothetical protein